MNYLAQLYPIDFTWKASLKTALLFGVFIALFLFVFRPFGSHMLAEKGVLLNAAAFGGITSIGILICSSLARLVPQWFEEANWTLGKELLWGAFNFLVITLLNYLLVRFMYFDQVEFSLWSSLLVTLVVGFFPFSVILLFNHSRMLRKSLLEAEQLNAGMHTRTPSDAEAEQIVIKGENEGEELEVEMHRLICLRSAGNYTEIFIDRQSGIEKHVFRLALADAERQLLSYDRFMRTHRSCILNLSMVARVEGNAQGYRVKVSAFDETLPVSRAQASRFKHRIKAMA